MYDKSIGMLLSIDKKVEDTVQARLDLEMMAIS